MKIKIQCEGCGFEFTDHANIETPEEYAERYDICNECGSDELFYFEMPE